MRVALILLTVVTAACGGDNPGQSVCDNVVPPPAAVHDDVRSEADAVNTCPGGYHCSPDGTCDARLHRGWRGVRRRLSLYAGRPLRRRERVRRPRVQHRQSATRWACQPTTITGTVFAAERNAAALRHQRLRPERRLLGPMTAGARFCDRCIDTCPAIRSRRSRPTRWAGSRSPTCPPAPMFRS